MWSSRVGKLQEVEGIIKGMLVTLDIRIGTDIVVIKSSLYVKMQLQQKLPLLIFSSWALLFELLFKNDVTALQIFIQSMRLFQDVSFSFSFKLWSRSLSLSELFLLHTMHDYFVDEYKFGSQIILKVVIYDWLIIYLFNLNSLEITMGIICMMFV